MKICTVCGARFRGHPTTCPLDGGVLEDLPDPMVGRTIAGRYVIHERVGAGGMGTVYRARHEVVGRDVAVKFLSPDLAYDPHNRQRFLREARAANRINHEHIIDITDYGESEEDGLVYLVMEFLAGVPLNQVIDEAGMPVARALRIALQIGRALARAHELDVIHRDIKPDNIFVLVGADGGDFVKILDFGLARMKGDLRITATGTIFGTPEYMSPEQARGVPLTPATDLYSVGVVLYEMLTGRLPFTGGTPDLILAHLRQTPEPPSRVAKIPAELDALVLGLLEKDPEQRLSAHDLVREVDELFLTLRRRRAGEDPTMLDMQLPKELRAALGQRARERDASEHPSDVELASRWQRRVDTLRTLAARAYAEEPPDDLARRLDDLDAEVRRLGELRDGVLGRAAAASEGEDEAREVKLRIGRALDALASDLDATSQELEALPRRRDEADATIREGMESVDAGWEFLRMHEGNPRDDQRTMEHLAAVGGTAQRVLDARRELAGFATRERELQRQRDDLTYQIGQLKGRLASVSAIVEVERDELRSEGEEFERQLRRCLDRLSELAAPLVEEFSADPELSDELRIPS